MIGQLVAMQCITLHRCTAVHYSACDSSLLDTHVCELTIENDHEGFSGDCHVTPEDGDDGEAGEATLQPTC